MKKIKFKICCITSVEDAKLIIEAGASALGIVDPMPSGSSVITNTLIREIIKIIPLTVSSFLLISETKAENFLSTTRKLIVP